MTSMLSIRARAATLVVLSAFLALATSILLAPSLAADTCFEQPFRATNTALPNILMIVTDDQRDGLGVMPNTRRIFRRGGTDYTDAFVSDPLCCPSRASIFTGRYPHNHDVRTEEDALNLAPGSTIQHYLERAGYCTAILGKYLNSWPIDRTPPDFNSASIFAESAYAYRNTVFNLDGQVATVPAYSTGFLSRGALAFLREANFTEDARPWFLYVATAAPHFPFVPAHKYAHAAVPAWKGEAGTRERNRSDKPPFVRAKR